MWCYYGRSVLGVVICQSVLSHYVSVATTKMARYLWNANETKLLRQQGQVGEANAPLHRHVNGTVAKIYVCAVKLQVCAGHNGINYEL